MLLVAPVAAAPTSGLGKPLFFVAESKWLGAPQADWATYMDAFLGVSA